MHLTHSRSSVKCGYHHPHQALELPKSPSLLTSLNTQDLLYPHFQRPMFISDLLFHREYQAGHSR